MSIILDISRATVARNIKYLIDLNIIKREGSTKTGLWKIKQMSGF